MPSKRDERKLWKISYTDDCAGEGNGCPIFSLRVKAYDVEHAEERFFETDDGGEGWRIVSIERVREPLSSAVEVRL